MTSSMSHHLVTAQAIKIHTQRVIARGFRSRWSEKFKRTNTKVLINMYYIAMVWGFGGQKSSDGVDRLPVYRDSANRLATINIHKAPWPGGIPSWHLRDFAPSVSMYRLLPFSMFLLYFYCVECVRYLADFVYNYKWSINAFLMPRCEKNDYLILDLPIYMAVKRLKWLTA